MRVVSWNLQANRSGLPGRLEDRAALVRTIDEAQGPDHYDPPSRRGSFVR